VPRDDSGIIIAINFPSTDHVHSDFAVDLARLISYTEHHVGDQIKALLVNGVSGSIVHKARQELAEQAERQRADYSLWIDSDMRFPRDALVRLLNRQVDIVGVNYVTRKQPMRPVALKTIRTVEGGPGVYLGTDEASTGLEEVEAIGFGMVLIHGSVWSRIGPPPWFLFEYDRDLDTHVGEDVYFCRLAREHGLKIMVDHDLSKEIRHIGQWEFRLDHLQMLEEAAEEAEAPQLEVVE